MKQHWTTWTDTQLWTWVLAHPIAGGRQDEPDQPTPPDPTPTPDPDPEPVAAQPKQYLIDGKPVQRWDEVYGKYTTAKQASDRYGTLGTFEDVQGKLAKLSQYEQAITEARTRANSTAEEQEETEKIRRQFFKLFPEMREVMESREKVNSVEGLQEQIRSLAVDRASQRFSQVMADRKLDVKYQDQLEDLALGTMSEAETAALMRGDLSVLSEVLDRLPGDFLAKFASAPTAPPPPPRRLGPSGSPPTPPAPAKGKRTMKEAHDGAFAALQAAADT